MIRCIYDECQYPDCDFTCEKDRDDIIKMLQERRDELLLERQSLVASILSVEKAARDACRGYGFRDNEYEACAKVCQFGYVDCIHNPEYLRRHHPEYWIKLGMPTECEDCSDERCAYDDEDK